MRGYMMDGMMEGDNDMMDEDPCPFEDVVHEEDTSAGGAAAHVFDEGMSSHAWHMAHVRTLTSIPCT